MVSARSPGAQVGPVVAQDDDYLYLAKAPGIPVFPPHGQQDGDSLLALLLAVSAGSRQPEDGGKWPDGFAGGLLHRLDTWTSGLVIAARSRAAWERGRAAFASHQLHKRYRFLTDRQVDWDSHRVDHELAHDARRRSRMTWRRGQRSPHRGRWYPASTRFRRIGGSGELSLWEATIQTGVMHQVRVHAASAGLNLLGDRLYGGRAVGAPGGRFFLHHLSIDGWPGSPPVVEVPGDWPTSAASLDRVERDR